MTKYLVVFLAVAVVAIVGFVLQAQSANTAQVVLSSRCLNYARDFDRVAQNSFLIMFNQNGYNVQQAAAYDICAGIEDQGFALYFAQRPPLQNFHRFEWANGDVYGYRGGPDERLGNIQYWICNDSRARVILSGQQVCSTL